MSNPLWTPAPELHTGDPKDDDAGIIDSLTEQQPDPPDPRPGATVTYEEASHYKPRFAPTRMFGEAFTATLNVNDAPRQIAPVDLKRRYIIITAISGTATDYVLIADERSKLEFAGISHKLYATASGNNPRLLDKHTGAVWIKPVPGASMEISYVSVTGDTEDD